MSIFPVVHFCHALLIVVFCVQAVPVKLSLDDLLQMSSVQVEESMKRLGSSGEECSRITAALSCLRSATDTGHCSTLNLLKTL